MNPVPHADLIAEDALDALFDLAANPVEGDIPLAKWLTGLLCEEQDAAAKGGNTAALRRASARVAVGAMCRDRICDALTKEAA